MYSEYNVSVLFPEHEFHHTCFYIWATNLNGPYYCKLSIMGHDVLREGHEEKNYCIIRWRWMIYEKWKSSLHYIFVHFFHRLEKYHIGDICWGDSPFQN